MTTRSEFLGRVSGEVRKTAGLFSALPAERPVDPRGAALAIRRELVERWPHALERFRVEFENVGGSFYRVARMDEVAAVVGRIASSRPIEEMKRNGCPAGRVVAWDGEALGTDLTPGLRANGLEVVTCDGRSEEARAGYRSAASEAQIGVTGADLALAETGTLILISGRGRPRSTSLLPPCHVAIFGRTALVESLEQVGVILEALHADPETTMSGAMINFITGPSRTADIELTLTRGVHGPKEVHAVFVESL
jgi:L-lactate dehydrogenase complex protein LldG